MWSSLFAIFFTMKSLIQASFNLKQKIQRRRRQRDSWDEATFRQQKREIVQNSVCGVWWGKKRKKLQQKKKTRVVRGKQCEKKGGTVEKVAAKSQFLLSPHSGDSFLAFWHRHCCCLWCCCHRCCCPLQKLQFEMLRKLCAVDDKKYSDVSRIWLCGSSYKNLSSMFCQSCLKIGFPKSSREPPWGVQTVRIWSETKILPCGHFPF